MGQLLAEPQEIKDPRLLKYLPRVLVLSNFRFKLAKFSLNSFIDQNLKISEKDLPKDNGIFIILPK
jgi:hypothetical protein